MSKEQRRLGRGIASLISADVAPGQSGHQPQFPGDAGGVADRMASHELRPSQRFTMIDVSTIRPNPAQPRKEFAEAALATLAESMKTSGTLQPIVVRPAEGGYELIAGERRLRAAGVAGMKSIPAIIRAVRDEDLLELALIENIQRENLNPVERARAYRTLRDQHGMGPEEIGKRTGEDRTTVSNIIRILELGKESLAMLATGELTVGHAKAALSIEDKKTRNIIISRIVKEGWSVRQAEAAAKAVGREKGPPAESKAARPAVADMERRMSEVLGTRVTIREGRQRHSGRITIEYYTLQEFERIAEKLGVAGEM